MKSNNTNNQLWNCRFLRWLPIFLMMLVAQVSFAQKQVNGTVLDDLGEPVIGANVLEKGTTNGVITDIDGNFVLQVKNNATLVVSFVGYASQEVAATPGKAMIIRLSEDNELLDEVVVVGYGAQKKESVVGAISQLSSKDMATTPVANVSNAIAGKIPGVVTTQSSGAPGADDAAINIRGRATFGNSDPLVLVDGVERKMNQVAPDDIESISVLKDAAATAVYGVRGANGVILVTTKRGKEQKPEVNFSASFQITSPTRKNTYLNSYESVKLLEEALSNDGLPSQFSANDIEMYRKSSAGELSGVDALLYPNVDWYDEVLNSTAPAQRYNVSVRGGTKRMRYYASAEYYNQKGLVKNLLEDKYGNSSAQSFQRFAFRANMDLFLTKDLTFSVNFGTRFEDRGGSNTNESAVYSQTFYELNHTPGWIFPVRYNVLMDGQETVFYGGSSQYQNNIVAALARGGYRNRNNTINETNFILDYKMNWLTEGLSFKAMFSFDYDSFYEKTYKNTFATYELNDRNNYTSPYAYNKFNFDGEMSMSPSSYTELKIYHEYQFNYARKFGKHDVTAMALYNMEDRRYQADLAYRRQGIVGRVTYNYDNRYLAEFNAGFNGSENFQKGQRFGFFPAFSLGWRIVGEKFMKKTENWLDNLKLRASYGEVGNDVYAGNRFLFLQKWVQVGNDYRFGSTGQTGIYEGQYPNYDVTWERAGKFNVGLEFGLWHGLLTGSFDYFYETRKDILTEYLSRPQWVGVAMAAGNLGETKNKGFEFDLHHFKQVNKDLSYTLGFNFSHSANEIITMDEPDRKTSYRKRAGLPINQYFGLQCDGFVTQADIDGGKLPISTFSPQALKPGDLKYRDINSDGFIDERDEVAIGYSDIPENTWAATAGITWKGISLNVMFQGVNHVSRYYDAEAMYAFVAGGKVKQHHLDRWNPSLSEADNLAKAKYPLLHYDANGNHNQRQNSFFLKDGSFVRLKNIELGYDFPQSWLKHVHVAGLRVYVNANNLVTWDNLDDLVDPESNGSNKYPIMKAWNFGLNLKF